MHLLLIEDDIDIANNLKLFLQENDFKVEIANSLKKGQEMIEKRQYDLILLDVFLPDGNGFAFYEDKVFNTKTPTIFLTAKEEENDIVKGLELGAEDYITKPFSSKELLARIKKVILRTKKNNIIKIKDITFDMEKMVVTKEEKEIKLTSLELKILELLFSNLNRVVTRELIIENIWNWTGNDVNDNTVTVYLKRIREKLDTDIILTIKGLGYRVDFDEK